MKEGVDFRLRNWDTKDFDFWLLFVVSVYLLEKWREIFQLFRSLVYFILPFTEVRNFLDRK